MFGRLLPSLLVAPAIILATVVPSIAQESNLETVEGPNPGEQTTLTVTPHVLTEEISARALGIEGPNGTRWALTLIGVNSADSIGLTMGGESLTIKEISRPGEEEVGPTRLYVSKETFLTIVETEAVRLHVGDTAISVPKEMREDMQLIVERVL